MVSTRQRERRDADVVHQLALVQQHADHPAEGERLVGLGVARARRTRIASPAHSCDSRSRSTAIASCPVDRGSRIQTTLRVSSAPTSTPAEPSLSSSTTGDTVPRRRLGQPEQLRPGEPAGLGDQALVAQPRHQRRGRRDGVAGVHVEVAAVQLEPVMPRHGRPRAAASRPGRTPPAALTVPGVMPGSRWLPGLANVHVSRSSCSRRRFYAVGGCDRKAYRITGGLSRGRMPTPLSNRAMPTQAARPRTERPPNGHPARHDRRPAGHPGDLRPPRAARHRHVRGGAAFARGGRRPLRRRHGARLGVAGGVGRHGRAGLRLLRPDPRPHRVPVLRRGQHLRARGRARPGRGQGAGGGAAGGRRAGGVPPDGRGDRRQREHRLGRHARLARLPPRGHAARDRAEVRPLAGHGLHAARAGPGDDDLPE